MDQASPEEVPWAASREYSSTLGGILSNVDFCIAEMGCNLSPAILAGLFGHAFESSYARGGAELWSGCCLEWNFFGPGLARLGLRQASLELIGKPPDKTAPTEEAWAQGLREGWQLVRSSIGRGVPVLAWGAMSAEQKEAGLNAYCWGVIYGVDPQSNEYLVKHQQAGIYRVRRDLIGRTDPVNWVFLHAFIEPNEGADRGQHCKEAVRDGLLLLTGERPSADMPAPPESIAHGVDAFRVLADELESGACPAGSAGWKLGYWKNTRTAAAEFCSWAAERVVGGGDPLSRGAALFTEQAEALERASSDPKPARVRECAEIQQRAIDVLKYI